MAAKTIIVLCVSALFVQAISAACINTTPLNGCGSSSLWAGNGLSSGLFGCTGNSWNGLGLGGFAGNALGYGNLAASSGGALPISSASPIAPSGVSVLSENAIEGPLAVTGKLPFLAAVALEGQVPTSGSAEAQYACGNGNVGITSESLSSTDAGYAGSALGFGSALGYTSSLDGFTGISTAPWARSIRTGTGCGGTTFIGNSCGCNRY